MKLFGNSKNAARVEHNKHEKSGALKLNGCTKTIIIMLAILAVLVLAVFVVIKVFVRPPEPNGPGISSEVIDPDTGKEHIPGENTKSYKDGYFNVLIAGTDQDGLRTDTIMIARIDTTNHSVALMSIPRDTMIETSRGAAKINSVYGTYGCGSKGMEALMLEVEDLLGFMPNGYVLVKINAFMELVNEIGGVYFNVPVDMYHNDPTQNLLIDLQAGYQLLDGNKAMQLVRFRGYGTADIERTHVQQKFLVAVAKQCLTLQNIGKIDSYCDILSRNVTTNYNVGNLIYFANELTKCSLDNMPTFTLAGAGGHYVDGVDYYKLDDEKVEKVVKEHFYPYTN